MGHLPWQAVMWLGPFPVQVPFLLPAIQPWPWAGIEETGQLSLFNHIYFALSYVKKISSIYIVLGDFSLRET
jgi:hypothetical protein